MTKFVSHSKFMSLRWISGNQNLSVTTFNHFKATPRSQRNASSQECAKYEPEKGYIFNKSGVQRCLEFQWPVKDLHLSITIRRFQQMLCSIPYLKYKNKVRGFILTTKHNKFLLDCSRRYIVHGDHLWIETFFRLKVQYRWPLWTLIVLVLPVDESNYIHQTSKRKCLRHF